MRTLHYSLLILASMNSLQAANPAERDSKAAAADFDVAKLVTDAVARKKASWDSVARLTDILHRLQPKPLPELPQENARIKTKLLTAAAGTGAAATLFLFPLRIPVKVIPLHEPSTTWGIALQLQSNTNFRYGLAIGGGLAALWSIHKILESRTIIKLRKEHAQEISNIHTACINDLGDLAAVARIVVDRVAKEQELHKHQTQMSAELFGKVMGLEDEAKRIASLVHTDNVINKDVTELVKTTEQIKGQIERLKSISAGLAASLEISGGDLTLSPSQLAVLSRNVSQQNSPQPSPRNSRPPSRRASSSEDSGLGIGGDRSGSITILTDTAHRRRSQQGFSYPPASIVPMSRAESSRSSSSSSLSTLVPGSISSASVASLSAPLASSHPNQTSSLATESTGFTTSLSPIPPSPATENGEDAGEGLPRQAPLTIDDTTKENEGEVYVS